MTAPEGAKRVKETWITHDGTRIGLDVDPKWPACYQNFGEMADADSVPFLNVRQTSECNGSITNISTKSKIAWPFEAENIGLYWHFPTPYNAGLANNYEAAAKAFKEILPHHSHLEFWISEDLRLNIKASILSAGYGPYGSMSYQSWTNHGYADTITSGVPSLGNRFQWLGRPLYIPNDTPISAKLVFDDYGKKILRRLELPPLDFKEGDDAVNEVTTHNQAAIELTLGGRRFVMRRAEYFA